MPVSFLSPFSPEASIEANKTKQLLLKDSISLMENSSHPQAVNDLLSWGLSPFALSCILKEFIFKSFSLLMVPFNFIIFILTKKTKKIKLVIYNKKY